MFVLHVLSICIHMLVYIYCSMYKHFLTKNYWYDYGCTSIVPINGNKECDKWGIITDRVDNLVIMPNLCLMWVACFLLLHNLSESCFFLFCDDSFHAIKNQEVWPYTGYPTRVEQLASLHVPYGFYAIVAWWEVLIWTTGFKMQRSRWLDSGMSMLRDQ
jgi:hypothetical protein